MDERRNVEAHLNRRSLSPILRVERVEERIETLSLSLSLSVSSDMLIIPTMKRVEDHMTGVWREFAVGRAAGDRGNNKPLSK